MYVVLKGNRLHFLVVMKQLPFLFMLQQFKSLRKFPIVFRTAPVTTQSFPSCFRGIPVPKECC